jgi:type II secretory pathway pseudopilin PulG
MQRRHFTMMEMIIVVLIVGMLLGGAAVQLDGFVPESRLAQQVRRTANLMDLASSQASVEGRPLILVFDRELRETRLEYLVEDSDEEAFSFEVVDEGDDENPDDEEALYTEAWGEGMELLSLDVEDLDGESSSADEIAFFPEGSCDGGEIVWREETGLKQSMELWPLLGKVSLSEVDDSEVWR